MKQKEVWRDVVGFEGLYKVSNLGDIYSIKSKKKLKQKKTRNTLCVYMRKEGKYYHLSVCKIVANAFVDNKKNYDVVKHLDGNINNNNATNLSWGQRTIYGVGVIDIRGIDYKNDSSYIAWKGMIWRCYDKNNKPKWYYDCFVCDEWLSFSNFKKWFYEKSDYQNGYCLDKDILIKGNKIYSPETCCFVPQEINKAILLRKGIKYDLPNGVSFDKTRGKFVGYGTHCKNKYFDNKEDAFLYFKEKKETYVKNIAIRYYKENKISKRVYDALLKFTVE